MSDNNDNASGSNSPHQGQKGRPRWDFHNARPHNTDPAEPSHSHMFSRLPFELQDMVYKEASHENEPQMRFVSLQQTVRHVPNCVAATCQCALNRPNYITFHPLLRSSLSYPYHDLLRHCSTHESRDTVVSKVSRRGRHEMNRPYKANPFPQQQGDWRLTQISHRDHHGAILGKPYRCTPEDLIFVHVPLSRDPTPMYDLSGRSHPVVTFDPLFEQIRSIAMSTENWEDLCYDKTLQKVYERMDANHAWQLVEEQGLTNVLEGRIPDPWPTDQLRHQHPWHPTTPQRELVQPALLANNIFNSFNLRIITDLFPALEEIWIIDLNTMGGLSQPSCIQEYSEVSTNASDCDVCGYWHEGLPKRWRGLDQMEFVEARMCSMTGEYPMFDTAGWEYTKAQIRRRLPGTDVHGNDWTRRVPTFKFAVPIWRTGRPW